MRGEIEVERVRGLLVVIDNCCLYLSASPPSSLPCSTGGVDQPAVFSVTPSPPRPATLQILFRLFCSVISQSVSQSVHCRRLWSNNTDFSSQFSVVDTALQKYRNTTGSWLWAIKEGWQKYWRRKWEIVQFWWADSTEIGTPRTAGRKWSKWVSRNWKKLEIQKHFSVEQFSSTIH